MTQGRKRGQVVTMLPSVGTPDPLVAVEWLAPVLAARIRADRHKRLLGDQHQGQADNSKGKPDPGSDDS